MPIFISAFPEDFCLTYVNTLSWRGSPTPIERLHGFVDILAWIEQSGVVSLAAIDGAREWVRGHKTEAVRTFTAAIDIREALFRIFSAIAVGVSAEQEDLLNFNIVLASMPRRDRIAEVPEGYCWDISQKRSSASDILAPVLWSAGDLMLKAQIRRIRRCANAECMWLFIDQSKTNTRRWCDMGSCGNRAKSRRHYARSKQHMKEA